MFIPLHDANHLRHVRRQYVTLALIGLNVAVFAATGLISQPFLQANAYGLGFTPAAVGGEPGWAEFIYVPVLATYVTYAFLHGDLMHLGGNMLFLWVFGDNVEDALGHARYLLFYLAGAAAGAVAHQFVLPESEIPLIGASGAVAAVVAAYVLLHPRVKLWVLVLGRIPLRLPAYIPLAMWIGYQLLMLATTLADLVSWPAHVGGIIAGAIMVIFLRRNGVPLFDREVVAPQAAVLENGRRRRREATESR